MTDWSYAKDVEMCALLVKGGRYRTLENWCETQKSVSTRKLSGRVESLHEFDKAIARRILSLTQSNKKLEAENAELRKVLADIDTKALKEMADEFECSDCDYASPMDMTTGVTDCALENRGETCRFVAADEMREFAKTVDTLNEAQRQGGKQ